MMPGRIPTRNPNPHYQPARTYERQSSRRDDKAFYASRAWKDLREAHARDHPLCAPCEAQGITTMMRHVHHVIPRDVDPSRAIDPGNLESVCIPCHNAKEQR
jgi:5-methylcytosine-specific restriction protein A